MPRPPKEIALKGGEGRCPRTASKAVQGRPRCPRTASKVPRCPRTASKVPRCPRTAKDGAAQGRCSLVGRGRGGAVDAADQRRRQGGAWRARGRGGRARVRPRGYSARLETARVRAGSTWPGSESARFTGRGWAVPAVWRQSGWSSQQGGGQENGSRGSGWGRPGGRL